VRQIRNDVMHSSDFSFTTAEMKKHLLCMINLLQDSKLHARQHTETAAKEAIGNINQVRQWGDWIVPLLS